MPRILLGQTAYNRISASELGDRSRKSNKLSYMLSPLDLTTDKQMSECIIFMLWGLKKHSFKMK